MGRGGRRAGAGRPRGSVNRKAKVAAAVVAGDGLKPLDVMLAVMPMRYERKQWDKAVDIANKLAPYFSQKFAATDQPAQPHPEQGLLPLFEAAKTAALGKKEQAALAAAAAGAGTDWGDDLAGPPN